MLNISTADTAPALTTRYRTIQIRAPSAPVILLHTYGYCRYRIIPARNLWLLHLHVAKECLDCQRYTTQKYGFHPLRTIQADLPMDHLAIDLFQMETSLDGKNFYWW